MKKSDDEVILDNEVFYRKNEMNPRGFGLDCFRAGEQSLLSEIEKKDVEIEQLKESIRQHQEVILTDGKSIGELKMFLANAQQEVSVKSAMLHDRFKRIDALLSELDTVRKEIEELKEKLRQHEGMSEQLSQVIYENEDLQQKYSALVERANKLQEYYNAR